MRVVFKYVREGPPHSEEVADFLSREDEFDAIGGWSFDELSLESLVAVRSAVERMEADLPSAMSRWREEFRPRFPGLLEAFKSGLAKRIVALGDA